MIQSQKNFSFALVLLLAKSYADLAEWLQQKESSREPSKARARRLHASESSCARLPS